MTKNNSIIGIHLDDKVLNIIYLGRDGDSLNVYSWVSELLEQGVIQDGIVINEEIIVQKIKDFVKTAKPKTNRAIMSLSCSAARLKPAKTSAATDEEIREKLQQQVAKYVLFGKKETVFDYCLFEQGVGASRQKTTLQAVATRQASDACLSIAQAAKLNLITVEPVVLPLIKIAYDKQNTQRDAVSLILALDSVSGGIAVFKGNIPQLCKNLTVGIKDLSEQSDGFIALREQLNPVLSFANSLAGSSQLTMKIAANCTGEQLGNIADTVKQKLSDVTVEKIDSTTIAEQFSVKNVDNADMPTFAFVSALAMLDVCQFSGQLNLMSQKSLIRYRTRKEMSLTTYAIVAVVLLSILAVIPVRTKMKSVKADSTGIKTKIAEVAPMKQKITHLKEQIENRQKKLAVYLKVDKGLINIPWPQTLQAIADTVPDQIRIVEISTIEPGVFTLLGEASTENHVYGFAKKLQGSKIIETAKVEQIEYDNDENAKSVVNYKIICKMLLQDSNL
ncbi:MAG: pilus assembly protein PilM [Planctomycetes bacterium]|nr:pilus assembly protein PilM [Planctomycetota bacterium]